MNILIQKVYLKYISSIRFAAQKFNNQDLVVYDSNFGKKKVQHPESSLGVIDQELWVLHVASARPIYGDFQGSRNVSVPQSTQQGQLFSRNSTRVQS